MNKKYVVDIETGEILNELSQGDRIIKNASTKYLGNSVDMKKEYRFKFIKLHENFLNILNELNFNEAKVCFFLMLRTKYNNGIIAYENGNIINSSDIAEIIGIDVRSSQRILKSLCDKEIICREKSGKGYVYYMNPYVCLKGSRVDKWLAKRFEKSKFNKSK